MKDEILTFIANYFINSGDFNGVPPRAIKKYISNEIELKAFIIECVMEGVIVCYFDPVNPHIKRGPDFSKERQCELLEEHGFDMCCLYPSPELVQKHTDISNYDNRPFNKMMLMGDYQLKFIGFDMGVLDRYVSDPSYHTSFGGYAGSISVSDEKYFDDSFPDKNKISLQSFGIGRDSKNNRVVVVCLRYLSSMSPEHQQSWNSFCCELDALPCKQYYQNAILGDWSQDGSFQSAISHEIKAINKILVSMECGQLFKNDFVNELPREVTIFTRLTLKNHHDFILSLDKMLSDNILKKFFDGKVELTNEVERKDGKIVVEQKGTLTLLRDWLLKLIDWDGDEKEAMDVIVGPLREVRALRQAPAHRVEKNVTKPDMDDIQHKLLNDVYSGLMFFRQVLAGLPDVCDAELPKFVIDGKIIYF